MKGLTREQIKLWAIVAMVVDHTAWGFVDFMTPLGQVMHIFGRFTMPIMCFFIAEGYRHTSSIKRYLSRMFTFSVISIIPFYIFFHEEYGYRQNIIFDLLLALLALCAMERKEWPKAIRIGAVILLIGISMTIGGWVIMPIVYVLVFYYNKDFKSRAKWFTFFTILMSVILSIAIVLNQHYHFSKYEWTVTERLYLLGFLLALIPLSKYNGQKGRTIGSRYFFYVFYPVHFLVLASVKYLTSDFSWQRLYILVHIIALFIGLSMIVYVLMQPTSRAQLAVSVFLVSGVMYIFGFLLEITTDEVAGVLTATRLQYFAEAMVVVAITFSIEELCHTAIPPFVYAMEVVVAIFTLYELFMYPQSKLMYESISINRTAGSFPRMEIGGYGIAFYVFVAEFIIVCIMLVIVGIYSGRNGDNMQKKRMRLLFFAMISMWMSYLIKVLNLTNGYEIPALFIPLAAFFIMRALVRYNFLDSVSLNFSNAVNHGQQGILAIDNNHRILYHNEWVHKLFGRFHKFDDAYRMGELEDVFEGRLDTIEREGHTYEMRVEPLIEQDYRTGSILWIFDQTEHYKQIERLEAYSTHDDLTGLHTRQWFEDEVNSILEGGEGGAFYMIDLDHFKKVNDDYGHQVGDAVLRTFADVLRRINKDISSDILLSGRLGGDEFCLFYRGYVSDEMAGDLANRLIVAFDEALGAAGHEGLTSISLGIALSDRADEDNYNILYKRADNALYQAKSAGRKTYSIYKDS